MAQFQVENQWGGSSAPWHPGGVWALGSRFNQGLVAVDISSSDGGRTLTGTITYSGEGPIGFKGELAAGDTVRIAGIYAIIHVLYRPVEPLETEGDDVPVATTPRMLHLLETARRVAVSRVPVILHGETGTGKEVLARLLHDGGPRRGCPMVRVNCGAIPASLVESTLFGHEKGSFTGAANRQKGVFEEADGGTVFLDEIGEMPLAVQAALLRVLETGAFSRVGSNREISVDVRVVAATHRDLEAMAAQGSFRADLYYRLGTVTLQIPPLRERTDEIALLATRFLRRASRTNGRDVRSIEPDALARLSSYEWPGNVRELRNAVEHAVVVSRGDTVSLHDLPARLQLSGRSAASEAPTAPQSRAALAPPSGAPWLAASGDDGGGDLRDRMRRHEARIILGALQATGWSRIEAARQLNLPLRTLAHKIKVLGIRRPDH